MKGESLEIKRQPRETEFTEINNAVILWFQRAREIGIPISGPMLQTVAMEFSNKMNIPGFAASNGWLDAFKTRYNIKQKAITGESQDADKQSAEEFRGRYQDIVREYSDADIFNADELGLLYRCLPDKSLAFVQDQCKGGKASKDRLTVLLCASVSGEKLTPLVIGKALHPRVFRNLNIQKLPVTWQANRNAWMTSAIFTQWLDEINEKMKRKNRKILLFVDNCAPHFTNQTFSNVELSFLPPNTTSELQPLDQGIIRNFKFHFRQYMLSHLVSSSILL